ncbi:NADH-quinone oxidoreductase subunit L [Candidatus Puniceispirillum marinum]|uniref:NADH:ubiquinone oxidoreductase subunit 5 n=1 Tax=Puniceispirillum marinum (strain IMCC1322) TaxID=488538 RepID=D5BPB3_PUNMI|nr:NADH-quinone oxidoreductase subunit L [Candidatus Puniceispirillum marinum]ADE38395.1 NADH:ubiquinone oxidoreductase subunit 5 [Candidatus Puniceispirillum marinum IMCC1322]
MYASIVFLPLVGSIIAGILSLGHHDRAAERITIIGLLLSLLFSIFAFAEVAIGGQPITVDLSRWIVSGDFEAHWRLRFDTLTAVMLIVVTGVSSMVHIYSVGYMSHDKGRARFMSYLSLFTFAMLMLVTADNLVQLFFGWEGVGVASYLLIGFWYHKESAHAAAMKAFVVNRVGDFGFALGILAVYALFGSVQFDDIFSKAALYVDVNINFLGMSLPALEVAGILLFIGAMGKSAQLGLHTWLPDAMEGPTPVSALIHAATMVTAGVFMVCRLSPVLEYAPFTLDVITVIGGMTAIFAATVGMTQFDIKRVIAYSTCSQLGYMFFAAGVSAYPAAMFHLTTHAFFKALLFLGAGSVIHAMSDEQDLRNMGGIWKKIPVTYVMMWVGSLALAGFPFFAGFYSKDMILEAAFGAHTSVGNFAFWMGCAAAFLTAFYSWRLLIMAFHGKPRASAEVMAHVHESPSVMTLPLFVLALGAIFSGWLGYELFVGHDMAAFWGDSIFILPTHMAMENAHHVPSWVKLLPIVLASSGVLLAVLFYAVFTDMPARMAKAFSPLYALFFNKWYFDEIYDALLVKPAVRIGAILWQRGDRDTIDGFGPDGMSGLVLRISGFCSRIQSGFVFHYAFAMLIGVVVLVSWYYFRLKGI